MTLTLKIEKQFFPHDTLPHNNTPQYQVWSKMVEWFRSIERTRSDTQNYRRTDGQNDFNINPNPPYLYGDEDEGWDGGGIMTVTLVKHSLVKEPDDRQN